jgi:transcriptional regulator with XRE-family HTH domain
MIFVTRTAISKWETDKGYLGIDSLKQISRTFDISLDDLISDDDVENLKLVEKNKQEFVIISQ